MSLLKAVQEEKIQIKIEYIIVLNSFATRLNTKLEEGNAKR